MAPYPTLDATIGFGSENASFLCKLLNFNDYLQDVLDVAKKNNDGKISVEYMQHARDILTKLRTAYVEDRAKHQGKPAQDDSEFGGIQSTQIKRPIPKPEPILPHDTSTQINPVEPNSNVPISDYGDPRDINSVLLRVVVTDISVESSKLLRTRPEDESISQLHSILRASAKPGYLANIVVREVIGLSARQVLLHLGSEVEARVLRISERYWTKEAFGNAATIEEPTFGVLCHGVPTTMSLDSEQSRAKTCRELTQRNPSWCLSSESDIVWIGWVSRKWKSQKYSSILIEFRETRHANRALEHGLFCDEHERKLGCEIFDKLSRMCHCYQCFEFFHLGQCFRKGERCSRCGTWGHLAAVCRARPQCLNCLGQHDATDKTCPRRIAVQKRVHMHHGCQPKQWPEPSVTSRELNAYYLNEAPKFKKFDSEGSASQPIKVKPSDSSESDMDQDSANNEDDDNSTTPASKDSASFGCDDQLDMTNEFPDEELESIISISDDSDSAGADADDEAVSSRQRDVKHSSYSNNKPDHREDANITRKRKRSPSDLKKSFEVHNLTKRHMPSQPKLPRTTPGLKRESVF